MSLPFDPRLAPVVPLPLAPAVPAELLLPPSLRQRFAQPPVWEPEVTTDDRWFDRDRIVPASVLVPLVVRPHLGDAVSVLFTRRTAHLKSHAGQVSFPGGRREASDEHDIATALREAREEVALDPSRVEVVGQLPPYLTATGFQVTPVVGLVQAHRHESAGLDLTADPNEVDEIFEVPLSFLMDPANHRRHQVDVGDRTLSYYAMPWREPGRDDDHFIWGATAAMLRNLYRFLAA